MYDELAISDGDDAVASFLVTLLGRTLEEDGSTTFVLEFADHIRRVNSRDPDFMMFAKPMEGWIE